MSYTPANNTQTAVVSNTGTLNSAPVVTQSGILTTQPRVMTSLLKRKILRAILTNRALQRSRSGKTTSPVPSVDMASAPVVDMGILEVNQPRVNIRLAPTTASKIIGELKRGDQVQPLSMRDGWIEFQFGDIIGWTKRGFLSDL